MAQAQRNAVEALERRLAESGTKAKILRELAEFLELPEPPARIEVYDNSHISGDKALGAMVVAGAEGFVKGQYRKFNIKAAQTDDDFAMMREVMARRFRNLAENPEGGEARKNSHETTWPDLVLIDGGKGQMSSVRDTLEEMGIEDVPLIAIAKGPHHGREGREVFHFPDGREKTLPHEQPAAVLPPDPARRGPPLRHRRAPRQAQPRDHRLTARRDPRHRPRPQTRAAAGVRDRGQGPRGLARRPQAHPRHQRRRGAADLGFLPPGGVSLSPRKKGAGSLRRPPW